MRRNTFLGGTKGNIVTTEKHDIPQLHMPKVASLGAAMSPPQFMLIGLAVQKLWNWPTLIIVRRGS
jgi:hypothetical protein